MREQTRHDAKVAPTPQTTFSPREHAVVERTPAGLTLKEMGGQRGCDLRTGRAYRKRAMLKCGARNLVDRVRIVSGWEPAARPGGGRETTGHVAPPGGAESGPRVRKIGQARGFRPARRAV